MYSISFSKTGDDDYTNAAHQDRITDNIWLTRLNEGGPLFNYKYYLDNNVNVSDIHEAVQENFHLNSLDAYGTLSGLGTGGTYGLKWGILSDAGFTTTTYSNPDLFATIGDPTNFFTFYTMISLLGLMSVNNNDLGNGEQSKPISLDPNSGINTYPVWNLQNGQQLIGGDDYDIKPFRTVSKDLACYIPETDQYFKIHISYWGKGGDDEEGYISYSRTELLASGYTESNTNTDPQPIINVDKVSNTLNVVRVLLTMKDISENKNYLYFIANDGTHGEELWRTDETENGTTLVKDIRANSTQSFDADNFYIMKDISGNENYLYFTANDGIHGKEIWRTNGTNSGTTLVKNINVSGDSAPTYLTAMEDAAGKNYLYFGADDGTNGIQLWKTDGTNSGTTLVTSKINDPRHLTVMEDATSKNYLYFRATDGTYGAELWRSDGTDSGTTLVKNIDSSEGSSPENLTVMEDATGKNYLYFSANDGTEGRELWRSDGTTNGTTMVKNISVGTGSRGPGGSMSKSSNPIHLTVMKDISEDKNYLYFNARSADPTIDYGEELWRTDGTESGTTMIRDILMGNENSGEPKHLTVMKDISENKNYLYFTAVIMNERRIWRTDGTNSGTNLVATNPYDLDYLTVMKDTPNDKNYLYFVANGKTEVWRTDGNQTVSIFPDSQSNQTGNEAFNLTVMEVIASSTNLLYFDGTDDDGNTTSLFRISISSPNYTDPIICFKEGTQILTLDLNTGLDTYKNIENINVGDLVSTYKHGNVPVNIIGYSILNNQLSNARITDKMYVYKKEHQPELIEDLYMTGGHCVLRDNKEISTLESIIIESENGGILYKTDDKVRMMAKLDYRCDTVDDNRQYRVWHICLDHENETMNYGIYANGMLVESTCERHAQNFLHKKENVVELIKDHCKLTSLLV